MKITSPTFWKGAGLLTSLGIRHWMKTIDFKAAFYDRTVDKAFPWGTGRQILLFWHEHILGPLFLRNNTHCTMLLSKHNDAEIVQRLADLFGLQCVRGSSFRGSLAAIKELLATGDEQNLAITPDGPRGPRRELAPGAIFLASKLQIPIVLFGFGFDRPWRVRSWDRFVVPRPFSRGRIIASPKIYIPSKLDSPMLEAYRKMVEQLLTKLTDDAEDWAVSGRRIAGESCIIPGPKHSIAYYGVDHNTILDTE